MHPTRSATPYEMVSDYVMHSCFIFYSQLSLVISTRHRTRVHACTFNESAISFRCSKLHSPASTGTPASSFQEREAVFFRYTSLQAQTV